MPTFLSRFLTLLCCASTMAASEHDPAVELASFQMAEGFQANLFASEKDGVIKPIQIRFDARGRLWVIGSTVYPQIKPGETPNDKVLILEDTNRDGVSDKTTVFADGLMIPTGLELGHGGAYIGHGSELLFLQDTDGDDRADLRKVILRGFGTADNHQNINSFLWGPGGELWMCQGLHTLSNVETPYGIIRMDKAGLWRFRPLLRKLEAFHGSEHEPQNPWGWVFTDWGEPIVLAGNNHSHIYPVPGLTSVHKDLRPHLIWRNGQGRKSSGGDIVGTSHFPPEWQGAVLTGGYINNAVWALKLSDDGAGFLLEDLPPLIRSTNRNFRPVDVKFGPDGALYICDWYNPIIGHYQASFRHPDRDKSHGRIWRVTAKGRSLTEPPALHGQSIRELLARLNSPDRWTRHFAKRVLADSPASEVGPAVTRWLAAESRSPLELKEGLGVLQSHEIIDDPALNRLAAQTNSGARAYAAQVLGLWAGRLKNPLPLLEKLACDPHPRVRLHAIVAASYLPNFAAVEALFAAWSRGSDKFIDYALEQSVFALKPVWLPALQSGQLAGDAPLFEFLIERDRSPDVLVAVRARVKSDDSNPRHAALLARYGTPEDIQFLLQNPDPAQSALILRTVRHRPDSSSLKVPSAGDLLHSLANSADPDSKAEALRLAGVWRLPNLREQVLQTARDRSQPLAIRTAAFESLSAYRDADSLSTIARAAEPLPIKSAAVERLLPLEPASAASLAARLFADAQSTSASHDSLTALFTAFLQRRDGPSLLHKAFESTPPNRRFASLGLELMNRSGRRDDSLAALFEKSLGHPSSTLPELPALVALVQNEGDAQRGALIYQRPELGCVACHKVYGEGGTIGPELSTLGAAQPVDFIIGAILDPQKEIKEGYLSISITTKDGEEHQGYLAREDPDQYVLRDSFGQTVSIPKNKVEHRRDNGSLMPEGLANTLSPAEFADLVKYLSTLGSLQKN